MKRRPAPPALRFEDDDDESDDDDQAAAGRDRRRPAADRSGGFDPDRAEKRMRMAEEALERGSSSDDLDDDDEEEEDDDDLPSRGGGGRGRPGDDDDDDDDGDEDEDEDDSDDDQNGANDNDDDDAFLHAPLESRLLSDLTDLPLDQRERMMRDGAGPRGLAARRRAHQAAEAQRSLKRESRDRPREMSSKRPVSRYREVIQVSRESIMGRDPRFPTAADALGSKGGGKGGKGGGAGTNDDEAAARKRYAFLYDEAMPRERAELKARLKREKSAVRSEEIRQRLAQVEQRLRDEAARRRKQLARDDLRKKEKAAVAEGKKPYFAKKSEVRAAELVARYEELKKGGKLEQYMEKRRRRNAAKDHRFIPSERRAGGG